MRVIRLYKSHHGILFVEKGEYDEKKDTLVPKYSDLIGLVFSAIVSLGGSASNEEILKKIIDDLKLSDQVVDELHNEEAQRTELEYRLAWVRTYLKLYGALANTGKGIWIITPEYADCKSIDSENVFQDIKKSEVTSKKSKVKHIVIYQQIMIFFRKLIIFRKLMRFPKKWNHGKKNSGKLYSI